MKKIEKYYNLISSKYDKATVSFNWIVPNEIENILVKYNLIKDTLEVLDVGIGTGQTIDFLNNKNCNIYGIDISQKMLEIVKEKYPKVETYKHDISEGLNNLFKENKFDLVIAGGILEFVKNIEEVFKDVFKLLKKDGYFVFTYEILISKDKIQNKREQYISEGYSEKNNLEEEFKLYRRSIEEMETLLIDCGLKIIEHKKIKAFLKTKNRIPVYYGLVLVRK